MTRFSLAKYPRRRNVEQFCVLHAEVRDKSLARNALNFLTARYKDPT
jgi:hypothetical protein